jgi:hypothetical protein
LSSPWDFARLHERRQSAHNVESYFCEVAFCQFGVYEILLTEVAMSKQYFLSPGLMTVGFFACDVIENETNLRVLAELKPADYASCGFCVALVHLVVPRVQGPLVPVRQAVAVTFSSSSVAPSSCSLSSVARDRAASRDVDLVFSFAISFLG